MKGSCIRQAVRYEVDGTARDIIACHCTQCRKASGHFTAATAVRPGDLHLVADRGLRWYRTSASAERGFCCHCGSTLFWRPDTGDRVSIYAGSIDTEHDLRRVAHIFAAEKGCYYDIDGGGALEVRARGGVSLDVP